MMQLSESSARVDSPPTKVEAANKAYERLRGAMCDLRGLKAQILLGTEEVEPTDKPAPRQYPQSVAALVDGIPEMCLECEEGIRGVVSELTSALIR